MNIRGYAGVLTSILAGIFVFDGLWVLTKIDVQDALAFSMFAALAAGIGFIRFVSREERYMDAEEKRETSRFETEGGLSVLIQRSSHRGD